MSKSIPSYLRLHTEELAQPASTLAGEAGLDARLCVAFRQATGWKLQFTPHGASRSENEPQLSAPETSGEGTSPGQLRLDSDAASATTVVPSPRDAAMNLARSIDELRAQVARLEHALWQREAELAAGVPVKSSAREHEQLAQTLEAALRGGCEALDCQAAALYLLDDQTSHLKLRAAWGLSRQRLADPPRPLEGALADLEALLGHAVVLGQGELFDLWKVPREEALDGAAVCVPVSTASTPLGTLWIYSRSARDFSDAQTQIVEIVAGRIAAELERQMLLGEGLEAARLKRQMSAARRASNARASAEPPRLAGWELASWSSADERLGGALVDWVPQQHGAATLLLGEANSGGLEGALASSSLRACLRAHAAHHDRPEQILEAVARDRWTESVGDCLANAVVVDLAPASSALSLSAAGHPVVVCVGKPTRFLEIPATQPLGLDASLAPFTWRAELEPGDLVLCGSQSLRQIQNPHGELWTERLVAELLMAHRQSPLSGLLELVRVALEQTVEGDTIRDLALWLFRWRGMT